ncbi:hypothetical protein O9993_00775 [Vibrio lentus]|nr:hypothetical protein [Vibrio lentus]
MLKALATVPFLALRCRTIGYKTRRKPSNRRDCGCGCLDCGIVGVILFGSHQQPIASTLEFTLPRKRRSTPSGLTPSFVICDCGSGDCVAINIGDGQNNSTPSTLRSRAVIVTPGTSELVFVTVTAI